MSDAQTNKRSFIVAMIAWLFHASWTLLKLAVLTAVVMAMVGGATYYVVKRQVRGETVEVPLIVEEGVFEALQKTSAAGLSLELERTEFNENIPPGLIIEQSPLPDSTAKKGTTVRVIVSGGSDMVRAPDLRGLNYKEAEIRIEQTGLELGRISTIRDDEIARGEVLASEPPARTPMTRGASVNLLISSGPPRIEQTMPRLIGMTPDEAIRILESLGLEIAEMREIQDPNTRAGEIAEQIPAPGVSIDAATDIVITISRGAY